MRYSRNVDLLVATIGYLGTNEYFWGRSAEGLAKELGLDPIRIRSVVDGFPGLYRRTRRRNDKGQPYYCLQARHAQRKGNSTKDLRPNEDLEPLSNDKLDLLIRFVLQMTEQEKAERRAWWTTGVAVAAAIVSAICCGHSGTRWERRLAYNAY